MGAETLLTCVKVSFPTLRRKTPHLLFSNISALIVPLLLSIVTGVMEEEYWLYEIFNLRGTMGESECICCNSCHAYTECQMYTSIATPR